MKKWLLLALWLATSVGVRADGPGLTVTPLSRDGRVLVSFELTNAVTSDVREAIQSGLLTTFSYELELRRIAPAWFDRTIASVSLTAAVRFDNLTRRYQMSRTFDGRVDDARPTEDPGAVQRWMTRFDRIPLSATSTLDVNGDYYVRVRAHTRTRNTWFMWPWERGEVFGLARFTFIP